MDTALAATGYRWEVEEDFKVADVVGHLQHRLDDKENKATVKRYSNMLKAGTFGNPICVTRDGVLIYGNHRVGSAKQVGQETYPAIVIDIDGQGADIHVTRQLLSVAYAENVDHGLPYTPGDRMKAAQDLLELGYTNRHVQAELGLSPAQVSGAKRQAEAEKRLETLGLTDEAKGIQAGVKRAFAGPDARALNDEPFKQLVELTKEAKLTGAEINNFAKEAKAAGSDVDALSVLNEARRDLGQRISEVTAGGSTRPTPIGKLKGALKQVTSLCGATTERQHLS